MTSFADTEPGKFNKICTWEHCDNWRRSNQIFCPADYYALPAHIRNKLWVAEPHALREAIKEAIQYLNDKRDNALIVHEEGP